MLLENVVTILSRCNVETTSQMLPLQLHRSLADLDRKEIKVHYSLMTILLSILFFRFTDVTL